MALSSKKLYVCTLSVIPLAYSVVQWGMEGVLVGIIFSILTFASLLLMQLLHCFFSRSDFHGYQRLNNLQKFNMILVDMVVLLFLAMGSMSYLQLIADQPLSLDDLIAVFVVPIVTAVIVFLVYKIAFFFLQSRVFCGLLILCYGYLLFYGYIFFLIWYTGLPPWKIGVGPWS